MYSRILLFFAGVLAVQTLADLRLALLALPLIILAPWRRALAPFVCGVLWAAAQAAWLLASGIDPAIEGETVIIRGTVSSVPSPRDRALRFEFDPEVMLLGEKPLPAPRRVSLGWYQSNAEPKLGEIWQFSVRLKRPWGLRNPGSFDFERWAFERGIRASGYIVASSYNKKLSAPARSSLAYWRGNVLDIWRQRFGQNPHSGLLTALILGAQQDISDDEWTTLRRTGTTHLISVSGLHVSLAAVLGYWLCRWGCCLWPPLLRRVPAQYIGWCGALLVAIGYALLTGASLPAQRAAIMLAVATSQRLRGRPAATAETFFKALLAILILYPLSVLAMGFWLSFGAVAIIFFTSGGRVGRNPWPLRLVRIHFMLAVGLAPMAALFFQQNPLLGPLANLIAVPVVSWIIFPLALASLSLAVLAPRWAEGLFTLAHLVLDLLWRVLESIASIDAGVLDLPASGVGVTVCAAIGVALLLAPRGLALRPLGGIWLLPLLLHLGEPIPPGTARIDVLDAGQALAVVVRTARHTLLFDTGLDAEPVVSVLRQQRVRRIDRVIISHADSDHAGGLDGVREAFLVGDVLTSAAAAAGRGAESCRNGTRWSWDGIDFAILHPARAERGTRNDASCVLLITNGTTTALLPGDIEHTAEAELLARDSTAVRADLLLAPHHGSASSSTAAFIAAVDPAHVVFASGYRNRFGFPAADVVSRYAARGVTMWRTDTSGMLRFELGATLRGPVQYRIEHLRYWHAR